jgi:hypothetical protein
MEISKSGLANTIVHQTAQRPAPIDGRSQLAPPSLLTRLQRWAAPACIRPRWCTIFCLLFFILPAPTALYPRNDRTALGILYQTVVRVRAAALGSAAANRRLSKTWNWPFLPVQPHRAHAGCRRKGGAQIQWLADQVFELQLRTQHQQRGEERLQYFTDSDLRVLCFGARNEKCMYYSDRHQFRFRPVYCPTREDSPGALVWITTRSLTHTDAWSQACVSTTDRRSDSEFFAMTDVNGGPEV